ncbi:EamA family transporter [Marinicaulis flavus]|uniref:EamA family transporter n=2 Tax=Hyphococcus luteus TaxID=2058213 RepID=A0A2S7K382_9PROT|nr:EamA family transporter [Marinicaulis flavus]
MTLFAFLISISFFLGKRAAPHIDPSALTAVRYMIAIPVMGGFAFFFTPPAAREPLFRPKAIWRFPILGGLMAIYFIMMFVALQTASSVSTGAVITLMPLMTAIFGFLLLRQKAGVTVMGSLSLAALGAVWVIFRGDINAILTFAIGKGELIFFLGVIAHALHNPLVRKLNRGEPTLVFAFWSSMGAGACLLVFGGPALLSTDWMHLPWIVWLCIAYLGTIATAGCYFLLQFALLRIPAAKANAYMLLTPSYVIIMEGFAGSGWVSLQVMAGALVTLIGLAILIASPEV